MALERSPSSRSLVATMACVSAPLVGDGGGEGRGKNVKLGFAVPTQQAVKKNSHT